MSTPRLRATCSVCPIERIDSTEALRMFAIALETRSTPLAWIYGIAKNTVNNHLRRARAQHERVEVAGAEATSTDWASTPHEDVEMRQILQRMDQRLGSVTRWQKEAFWLRHVEDLSIEEIASRMERSNDAVRSGLYRVKRMLVEAGEAGGCNEHPA